MLTPPPPSADVVPPLTNNAQLFGDNVDPHKSTTGPPKWAKCPWYGYIPQEEEEIFYREEEPRKQW